MGLGDRVLRKMGLQRIQAHGGGFDGGSHSRLLADWVFALRSTDQKIYESLTTLRSRARQLVENNEYAARFINKSRENVIGPNGLTLQMGLSEDDFGSVAEETNRAVELAWSRWSEAVSTCGQMSLVDCAQLWLGNVLTDGEDFTNHVKGYPHNPFRFALQSIDPEQVDITYNRGRRQNVGNTFANEIRLGVELDEWRRPVAYWVFEGHPAEMVSLRRRPLSATDISHSFLFKMRNQTRGVPAFAAAMVRLYQLGEYEEAELIAARLGACKMAAFTSKTGEDYVGEKDKQTGAINFSAEAGTMFRLPDGVDVKPIDWNHPNQNFPEFSKSMLRAVSMGLNGSYTTLSGDLRDVNFSSIRQGILDEREGWKVLQTFAIRHFYMPVFRDWLPLAITTGQLDVPAVLPLPVLLEAASWEPRGWDWVDPRADVDADIKAIRAGLSTLQESCAKRGKNWRDNINQRAKENAYAAEKGVPLDFSTSGSGGVEGDTAEEEPAHGVQPAKPSTPPPARPNPQPKGQPYVRLEQ